MSSIVGIYNESTKQYYAITVEELVEKYIPGIQQGAIYDSETGIISKGLLCFGYGENGDIQVLISHN